MFNQITFNQITFEHPEYLLLALALPLLWIFSFSSLAGLGAVRRIVSLTLRTLVFLAFVVALAEIQWVESSERVTVMYLLDMSDSIPNDKRTLMLKYVSEEVARHSRTERDDRAGVIIFGRNATIEDPPLDASVSLMGAAESELESTDATNLESALKLAQASFPEDTAKRIVILTDGNENLGNARQVAPTLVDNEIGIDIIPIRYGENNSDVLVEKVSLPPDVRRDQPTEIRVVINNPVEPTADVPEGEEDPRSVTGMLRVTERMGKQERLLSEGRVTIPPGKKVFRIKHKIDKPAVYTYDAVFTADDPDQDLVQENNRASAFTHVRGKGQVLLIEDWEHPGEFAFLIERLRAKGMEVDVQSSDQLFSSLSELQGYDSVVLANVPRTSGETSKELTNFSNEQIQMLVRNTQQMGCGLVMLGGPNSFGAGGWANTELEKAMPVDFQIKNAKIQAVGALVLMMHASEMAQGNHWQKVVGREAVDVLGPMDYCGLLHWDNLGGDAWLWGKPQGLIRVGSQKRMMKARMKRMTPGDMPQFDPAMRMALAGFNRVNASVKHMIIISDGDPAPPRAATVAQYKTAGIKISTVAVGTHGPPGSTPLQSLANQTGGKYYVVANPKALPKIYQKEARRVARPLVKDLNNVSPNLVYPHEMLEGIDPPLPPITGFVMTTLKDSPLVEQAIICPDVDGKTPPENATILAAWNYGAGRTAVWTTDCGKRWATSWTEWENYEKLFSQMIRWSMRPVNDENKFTVNTDYRDGKVQIVVTALDKDNNFLNGLNLDGDGVGPDLKRPIDLDFKQVAPGRYVSEFEATHGSGSYLFNVKPGKDFGMIRTGVSVPYSAEFRDREANDALLKYLAQQRPKGGEKGAVIGDELAAGSLAGLLEFDTFRHNLARAISSTDVWARFMMLAAFIFFADVFVRRVTISYEWIAPIVEWVRVNVFRREQEAVDERLERLRSRKQAIAQQIDERRSAQRFEPIVDADPVEGERDLDDAMRDAGARPGAPPPRPTTGQQMTPGEVAEDDYTSRLLAAKRKALNDQQKRRE